MGLTPSALGQAWCARPIRCPEVPGGARVLVVLPTFNERHSLPRLLADLWGVVPHVDVLVVDDASPDGTGEWAEATACLQPRLAVLHRPAKLGLGSAYKEGFSWGLAVGYEVLCSMDADGSHRPRDLPELLRAVEEGADLALGSRWTAGGGVVDWPTRRWLLSRTANGLARRVLHLGVADATTGFRAYRASALAVLDVTSIEADGYAFLLEVVWRAAQAGLSMVERPIVFRDRRSGQSKIDRHEIGRAAATLLRLRRAQTPGRAAWHPSLPAGVGR
jgi:dolichol-phosphate mannosyltransferase